MKSKTVNIRCAYCLEPVTVEVHASILGKYGSDYEPTRCAACEYLKQRRVESLNATPPTCLECGRLLKIDAKTGDPAPCRQCLDSIGDSLEP